MPNTQTALEVHSSSNLLISIRNTSSIRSVISIFSNKNNLIYIGYSISKTNLVSFYRILNLIYIKNLKLRSLITRLIKSILFFSFLILLIYLFNTIYLLSTYSINAFSLAIVTTYKLSLVIPFILIAYTLFNVVTYDGNINFTLESYFTIFYNRSNRYITRPCR